MISPDLFTRIACQWGLRCKTVRSDMALQGSPERVLSRTVIEDETGSFFVIERIAPVQLGRKRFVGLVLDQLHADGLRQISPYLKTSAGEPLVYCDDGWWQISPYITGTPLDRPGYIQDSEKGEALAFFLGDLSRHTKCLSPAGPMYSFSLKRYILKLERTMTQHDPGVGRRFAPVFDFLHRSFLDAHDFLPVAFCHGDYHPLNVIWQGHTIKAVIDWEFCGLKTDIYDTANMVGCVGMENPSGLTDGLLMTFIGMMQRHSTISPESWKLLVEFVIALRFAWLAEWLRKKDREMIDLEATYMSLLLDNRHDLKKAWGCYGADI